MSEIPNSTKNPRKKSEVLNLTKRAIDSIQKPGSRKVYLDSETDYLRLVITAEDRRTWRFVRKVSGRVRFITIGTYPSTTPAMARAEAKRISAEYDAGRDPAEEKKQLRKVKTWAELFDWYIENHAKPHKKSWQDDEDLNRLYCSQWTRRPYTAITVDVVTRWHKRIGREKNRNGEPKTHQADRVLAMVKTVFSKAIAAEVITGKNPAQTVSKFYSSSKQYSRDRFLSGDEIGRLLQALAEYHDQDASDFFTVALFCGARRANVQAMRWQDMDLSDPEKPQWRIPGDESKNKEPMQVQIVEPVISILNRRHEEQRERLCSLREKRDLNKLTQREAASLKLAELGEGYVFPPKQKGKPKKNGEPPTPHLTEPKRAWKTICHNAGIEKLRIHDLRRTLGSWQAIMGASLQIIGKSLGHKSTQSTEIYARLDRDPVRDSVEVATRKMLELSKASDRTAETAKTP
jgi:integrase